MIICVRVSVTKEVSSSSVLLNLLTKGIDANWGYKLKDCLPHPALEVLFIYTGSPGQQ